MDGKIPCVIGGVYASRFKVGDTLPGYAFNTSSDGVTMTLVPEQKFIVTGVLSLPQQTLSTNSASYNVYKASDFFDDMTNHFMFMIAPSSLYQGAHTSDDEYQSSFLYLDRSCTQEQINMLRNEFGRNYTGLDTEIIEAEQNANGRVFQEMMPFLITIFLVVFLGLISMSMLTAMRNLQTFKIYYLTGCPRKKLLQMMLWYIFLYLIPAFILFMILLTLLRNIKHQFAMLNAYFILQPQTILAIGIICAVIVLCSLLAPYLILRKNDLAALLRKE